MAYVSEVMNTRVVSISSHEQITKAAQLMSQHNIGSIPVVDNGQIKGMLTDRDIVLRCVAQGKDPSHVKAGDIMTTGTVYITPHQSVDDAVRMMSYEQIRRLPVVEDGKLAGIISLADLARMRDHTEVAQAICEISKP